MKYLKLKSFDNVESDVEHDLNEFLMTLGKNVQDVQAMYNTILGGVVYVVFYWVEILEEIN